MHPNTIDMSGKVIGRLTVIKDSGKRTKGRSIYWLCECTCGNTKEIIGDSLRSGNTTSCGCLRLEKVRKPSGEAILNRLFKWYRDSADKRNISWLLSKKDFSKIIYQDCYYCGEKPMLKTMDCAYGKLYCNGIDRIDSSREYSKLNCASCCSMCNQMKWTYSAEEFLSHIRKIYRYNP